MGLQFLGESDEQLKSSLSFPADFSVAKILKTDVLYCSPSTSLNEAASLMQERNCSSIIVLDNNSPKGIWTEQDALLIDFDDPAQFTRPINEVMSQPVISIHADTLVSSVATQLQKNKLRHFLVVDDDENTLGLLSQSDIVEHQVLEHYLDLRSTASVLRRNIPRLAADTLLSYAVRKMQLSASSAIIINYPDQSYGILTERDLVHLIAQQSSKQTVGDVASRPLICIPHDMSLYRARKTLSERGIRHVGVTQNGELLGLVSFREIMMDVESAYMNELREVLQVRDQALSAAKRNLQLAERVIDSTLEGVIITDPRGRILFVNPAFSKITGYSDAEVIGKTPAILKSGHHNNDFYQSMWLELQREGRWEGEVLNRKKNGELLPKYLSITTIYNEQGQASHYASMFNDISKLKESEENIRNMAYRDPLTGLPNRRLLEDRLDMLIAQAERHNKLIGVLFIDLDHFKHVNDSLGHAAGDELLVELARRLKNCLRKNDTVARLGGDEFVIILSQPKSIDDIAHTAERLMNKISRPILIHGRELVQTSSIGVSVYPNDALERDTLLKHADAAMYAVKSSGRDGLSCYVPSEQASFSDQLTLRLELRQALKNGQIMVYYQPLMDSLGQLVGAEALLRWQHPERGFIPPDSFIPLAEDSGLILPIGIFVLQQATEQFARWNKQGMRLSEISINVSGRQLRDQNFIRQVSESLKEHNIAPRQIVFELTESVLMDKISGSRLQDLKDLGVSLALDDFGTGYAALLYLRRFPLDRLKIDRSFVREMLDSSSDATIVSTLITLANKLKLQVVAEGVERSDQFETLRDYGCELFQGFLFSQALAPAQFEAQFLNQVSNKCSG